MTITTAPYNQVKVKPITPHVFKSGMLSNFADSPFDLPGPGGKIRTYRTVEHYFQASKTTDAAAHDRVVAAASPKAAKAMGRGVDLRSDWEEVKSAVMLTALRAKFSVDPFRAALERTGTSEIIEESDHDLEWGAKSVLGQWSGDNLLGCLLMKVREELRAQPKPDGQQLRLIP